MKNRLAAWLVATAALLAPRVSEACAVCSFRDDGTQKGYLIGTLFMTLLPFAVIGSILLVIRRRLRGAPPLAISRPGPSAPCGAAARASAKPRRAPRA